MRDGLKAIPQAWLDHDRAIQPYLWSHRIIGWARSLAGLLLVAGLVFRGWGGLLQSALGDPATFLTWWLFFLGLAAAWELLSLPFDYAGYWVERHFGLSRQGLAAWLVDHAKGLAVGAVLGSLALGLLYVSVRWGGAHWWWIASTLFLLFSVVLAQLAPVILIPIFFKLKPMEPGALKDRLLALCGRHGVRVKDVYHLGLGEKTEKGNAAFVGLGATKRILIGDTLYEKYSVEQVEAVFGHELGHQVHGDLWKGLVLSSVFTYAAFFAADAVGRGWLYPSVGFTAKAPFGMLATLVALTLVQMPMGVVQAAFSRWRERKADAFAGRLGLGAPLAEALERLTYQNRGQFVPNAVREFLTYSHPAPWRRVLGFRGA